MSLYEEVPAAVNLSLTSYPRVEHPASMTPEQAVSRCQDLLSHAWMVRTFVKHSPEVEDFPELMEIVRTVFDVSRALETRVDDPAGYLLMLRKKIGKLRQAAAQFREDAPRASDHTNFKQAVLSIEVCVRDLEAILRDATAPASGLERDNPQPAG